MEEFGRNFVYKQVGHIITAEEYKCQVQPSHRTEKSISKSTWAPEPQTCRRSSNGIWVDLHQRRNLCENEEKAIFVLLSTKVNRYESKNFLLSGDQLLIDRSIEKEEFSTDFVASTGNYCRVMERALKIRQRNHIL
ncbi:MEMO1 family protein [Trichinella pseudospiralis]